MPTGRGPLRIAIEDFINTGPLRGLFRGAALDIAENWETDLINEYREWAKEFLTEAGVDKRTQQLLLKPLSGEHQTGAAIGTALIVALVVGAVTASVGPFVKLLSHPANQLLNPTRFTPQEAVIASWRRSSEYEDIRHDVRDEGLNYWRLEIIEDILRPRLPDASLMGLWWRYAESRSRYEGELGKRGYTTEEISNLVAASESFPGPQDIIRFAVREAFTPTAITRFGLMEDLPNRFVEEMSKQGYANEWANAYWVSHWNLPSPTQVFEMYQRLRPGTTDVPFTSEDLDSYLKYADYPPYYRERLRQISYIVPRLVDIRSLFQTGVWSNEQVYNAYLDRGYAPEIAQSLTAMTTRERETETIELSRSTIVTAYRRGAMSEPDARSQMVMLGLSQSTVDFWIYYADYQKNEQLISETLDVVEAQYIDGTLTDEEARTQLSNLPLTAQQVNNRLTLWSIRREKKVKLPSNADLKYYYKNNLIDETYCRNIFNRRRVDTQAQTLMLQRWDIEAQEETSKEVERTQKEQERLAASELRSDYLNDRAELDVQIAEMKVQLADLKVARHETEDIEELTLISEYTDIIKADIARLNLDKANLTQQYRG